MDAADAYASRICRVMARLGLSEAGRFAGVPLCPEASGLVSVGTDVFGREQFVTPDVAPRWAALVAAAAADGVSIGLVSAFRSVDQQVAIFERKLAAGIPLADILTVNAPPGYSEHHTGRAVDVTAPGLEPLTEAFEQAPAFDWLVAHADALGLRLSYPRHNPHGFVYEPWHWYFLGPPGSAPR